MTVAVRNRTGSERAQEGGSKPPSMLAGLPAQTREASRRRPKVATL